MQPISFEFVPQPLTIEHPHIFKDGQTKRRERRALERKRK